MGYIRGEGRGQATLFPVVLDDMIPADHVCRVIDAFVAGLSMAELGFERAEAAVTGRPGYDPGDLLKLYLYGYLHKLRSSRCLEAECQRNVELLWLLGRLYPDHKSIAEFRRMHREAVTAAGAELVRFAQRCGLIKGEWIAIDGSKFQAVSSRNSVAERKSVERYLDSCEKADMEKQVTIDPSAVSAALAELKAKPHREPEADFMKVAGTKLPAYNVQTAVDSHHSLIVTHAVTLEANDKLQLEPMAKAAKEALKDKEFNLVADAGYSNGEQAARCESSGIIPHVPVQRSVNTEGLLDRSLFQFDAERNCFVCPEGKVLKRYRLSRKDTAVYYRAQPAACAACSRKTECTKAESRSVTRHLYEDALNRMQQRTTPESMNLRRCTVEHPFAGLKYHIFGHPRLLLRGSEGARIEIGLAVMVYNLKRIVKILGAGTMIHKLQAA